MKQCPICHQSLEDSARFCGVDGAQLIDMPQQAPSSSLLLSAPLTPSEMVLLHAESFAPKAGLTDHKVKSPQGEDSYSAQPLGRMILAAAILANEQVRYLSLQVAERRALLRTCDMFIVVPGAMPLRWAADSIEDYICRLIINRPPTKLDDIVYALWQSDFRSGNVWKQASWIVERGLAARNLLEPVGGVVHTAYRLKEGASQVIAQQPLDSILSLIGSTEQAFPVKWHTLQNDIGLAVLKRTLATGSH